MRKRLQNQYLDMASGDGQVGLVFFLEHMKMDSVAIYRGFSRSIIMERPKRVMQSWTIKKY